jgi:hypothetical protein
MIDASEDHHPCLLGRARQTVDCVLNGMDATEGDQTLLSQLFSSCSDAPMRLVEMLGPVLVARRGAEGMVASLDLFDGHLSFACRVIARPQSLCNNREKAASNPLTEQLLLRDVATQTSPPSRRRAV